MIHIIDNEPFICDLVSTVAAFLGSPSKTFGSERSYLCYMLNDTYTPPDMMFSNIDLPEGMGCALSTLIKQQYPDVTFILMREGISSAASCDSNEHKNKHPVDHILQKPFNVRELTEFVGTIPSKRTQAIVQP